MSIKQRGVPFCPDLVSPRLLLLFRHSEETRICASVLVMYRCPWVSDACVKYVPVHMSAYVCMYMCVCVCELDTEQKTVQHG